MQDYGLTPVGPPFFGGEGDEQRTRAYASR
jgi:hypothetical protein